MRNLKYILFTLFALLSACNHDIAPKSIETRIINSTEIVIDTVCKVDPLHEKALQLQEELDSCKTGNYKSFLDKLAFRESSNNWKSINKYGYIGKYQFGPIAFKDVGMKPIDTAKFHSNPNIFTECAQDSVVNILINHNKKYLRRYIPTYSDTVVHGINITESGLIGAAHLVGNGNVKKWLNSNGKEVITDANGVSIEEYLVIFAHYKV